MPPEPAVSTINPNASDYGVVMKMEDNGTVRPRRDDEKSVAGEDDDGVRTYFVICPATAVRFPVMPEGHMPLTRSPTLGGRLALNALLDRVRAVEHARGREAPEN